MWSELWGKRWFGYGAAMIGGRTLAISDLAAMAAMFVVSAVTAATAYVWWDL